MKNFLLPVTGVLVGCVPASVDVPLDLDAVSGNAVFGKKRVIGTILNDD